jgi:M6 family metalloprotease-like protein
MTAQNAAYYAYEPQPNVNPNYPVFAREAITAAYNDGVDFSEFAVSGNQIEGVYCIYAGYDKSVGASNSIWAHAQLSFNWSYGGFLFKRYAASSELRSTAGSNIANIGTCCHEYGHVLGAYDYYDTDGTANGEYDGTGYWDLQASGSHNDSGKKPATPNPRSKVYTYGWANAIELSTPQRCTIPVSRIYDNAYYRINTPAANQYFIIENKERKGFDESTPGANLLIYKCTDVYETSTPYYRNTTSWQRFYPVSANAPVAVPEAGSDKQKQYGNINSSSCTWPTSTKTSFTNTTTPAMITWDGTSVNKPITNIVVHDDYITFDFIGGGTKSNFHVFLPAYYGCIVTPQSGSTSPVNSGGSFSFKIDLLPSHIQSNLVVKANNETLLPFGNTYTIYNIQADQVVKIEGVKFNNFPITANKNGNGTITPEGEVPVNQGASQLFEIRPDNGYSISKVIVDDADEGAVKSYTFVNVQEPHAITAIFKKGDLYTINTSKNNLSFETFANVPSESIEVTVSSPNVIANITVSAPERFQVSANNGQSWQQGFLIQPNKLPFPFLIRFAPPWGMENVGTFDTILTLKSTDAYAEIKIKGVSLLGINDYADENAITIYPNPTTGKLNIVSDELRIENIEIFDVYGRKVFEQKAESRKQNEIDITNLSTGIYMVTIHTDKGVVNKKVIKE